MEGRSVGAGDEVMKNPALLGPGLETAGKAEARFPAAYRRSVERSCVAQPLRHLRGPSQAVLPGDRAPESRDRANRRRNSAEPVSVIRVGSSAGRSGRIRRRRSRHVSRRDCDRDTARACPSAMEGREIHAGCALCSSINSKSPPTAGIRFKHERMSFNLFATWS